MNRSASITNRCNSWYESGSNAGKILQERMDPETNVSALQVKHPKGQLSCGPKGELVLIQNTVSTTLPIDVKAQGIMHSHSIGPGGILTVLPSSNTNITFHRPLSFLSISIPVNFVTEYCRVEMQEFENRVAPLFRESLMEPFCTQAMQSIWSELGNEGMHSRLLIGGTTCALLGSILRKAESLSGAPSPRLQESEMLQVADTIETNLDDQIVLEELAGLCDLSLVDFQSAFKNTFGMSSKKYIVERRVSRARTLITESKESFAGIAAACGFYDQSHMIHTFKRQLGCTPGKLRDRVLIEVAS